VLGVDMMPPAAMLCCGFAYVLDADAADASEHFRSLSINSW